MDKSARVPEMRTYELTYILAGNLTDQELDKARAEIEPLFKRASMQVKETQEWGKKPLAYIITHGGKKQTDGYYVHLVVQMPADKSQELDRELYLHSKVMRHLLLVSEEAKVEQKPE